MLAFNRQWVLMNKFTVLQAAEIYYHILLFWEKGCSSR